MLVDARSVLDPLRYEEEIARGGFQALGHVVAVLSVIAVRQSMACDVVVVEKEARGLQDRLPLTEIRASVVVREGKIYSGRDNHYRSGHRIVSQSIKPKIKDSRVDLGEESGLRRKTSTPLRGEIDPDKARTMRPSLGDFPRKE